MLTSQDIELVYQGAQVPEQVPNYVQAISGAEPFVHTGYLCYYREGHMIFVGYPLVDDENDVETAYESACRRFRPITVAVIGPRIRFQQEHIVEGPTEDMYYRLNLPLPELRPDLAYMIRRADRELRVLEGTFGGEHERLVNNFIIRRNFSAGHQEIFRQIPVYLEKSRTARLLEARKDDDLVAFNVLELGSSHYGFYLFNFRSLEFQVPGASDLLFCEMAHLAEQEGKRAINLGLGINPGVRRFKEKWGALPFLSYSSAVVRRRRASLLSVLTRL
jgi:hypothetical protein